MSIGVRRGSRYKPISTNLGQKTNLTRSIDYASSLRSPANYLPNITAHKYRYYVRETTPVRAQRQFVTLLGQHV